MALPYFIWKGKSSQEMGVIVSEYPPISRATERTSIKTVPGRPGHLTMLESDEIPIYDGYLKTLNCYIRPGANKEEIFAWLSGGSQVIFGNEPNRRYFARITNQIDFDKIVRGRDYYSFAVPFYVQPFKGQYPIESTMEITVPWTMINNPGTVPAYPTVTLYGNGAIDFHLGGGVVKLKSIVSGIILDWDSMECMSLDKASLLNHRVSGTQFIPVGNSQVGWTGSVSRVVIQPNWRWL